MHPWGDQQQHTEFTERHYTTGQTRRGGKQGHTR